ncbi:MAG: V-type ATP synthase subunit K, partial [Sphaerochaetaceae bacterium]|nr:V-type ATP synthase subunit K [Sphaerochaetaceae bacterium]
MNIGLIGMAAALGLSALGSALGTGAASLAAVGGWKKCYANGKPAPFIMVAFSGAPLTQTIYGFLLMNFISAAAVAGQDAMMLLGAGVFGGLAIGLSA